MSKNFELLQQLGNEEELFRTPGLTKQEERSGLTEAEVHVDEETRERILQKSSLPNVLRLTSHVARAADVDKDAMNTLIAEEKRGEAQKDGVSTEMFRTSRNPSVPIGPRVSKQRFESEKDVELKIHHELPLGEKTRAKTSDSTLPNPINGGARWESVERHQRIAKPKGTRATGWLDLLKKGARQFEELKEKQNGNSNAEREVIAREQEMKLVQRVFPEAGNTAPGLVLFAGLEKDAGCASICARTARILAARGEGRVCAVDANFGAPSLHHSFGIENRDGLAEMVLGICPMKSSAKKVEGLDLWVIPSGGEVSKIRFPEVNELMKATLKDLRNSFRYVVLHCSPFRLEIDSNIISRWTDGVVLVLEANSSPRDTARRVKENLETANVSVLGVVLNNRTFPIPEPLYRRL
jgi:Mrp family chromosome partitioning ATPase